MSVVSPKSTAEAKPRALLVTCLITCFLFCGVHFGWSQLLLIWEEENVYRERCDADDTTVPCHNQESIFTLIFTVASSACGASGLLTGFILDRYGPSTAVIWNGVCFITSLFLFAFANSRTFDAFLPAGLLMGVGGGGHFVGSIPVAFLFDINQRATIISGLSCLYDASAVIGLFFAQLYLNAGVSRASLFVGYAILSIVLFVLVYILWRVDERKLAPPSPTVDGDTPAAAPTIELQMTSSSSPKTIAASSVMDGLNGDAITTNSDNHPPHHTNGHHVSDFTAAAHSVHFHAAADGASSPTSANGEHTAPSSTTIVHAPVRLHDDDENPFMTVKSVATSTSTGAANGSDTVITIAANTGGFVRFKDGTLWQQVMSTPFWMLCLWSCCSVTRSNSYMGAVRFILIRMGDHDDVYIAILNVLMPFAFLCIPPIAFTVNRYGMRWALHTTTFLGMVFGLLTCFENLPLQVVTFVAFILYRGYLYSVMADVMSRIFGGHVVGRVMGILYAVCAGVGFIGYPAVSLTNEYADGDFLVMNLIMLSLTLPCIPLVEKYHAWQLRQDALEAAHNPQSVVAALAEATAAKSPTNNDNDTLHGGIDHDMNLVANGHH